MIASGSSRNAAKKRSTMVMRSHFTHDASPVAARGAAKRPAVMDWIAPAINSGSENVAGAAAAPPLDEVDQEQDCEGHEEHHHADGGRALVVVFLELRDDEHRGDLGLEGEVCGAENDGAVFAHRAPEGEGDAGEERRQDGGQDDFAEGLQARGTKAW